MFEGRHDTYKWLETGAYSIHDLLQDCPEVLLDKYLVITARNPSTDEMEAGWTAYRATTCSPRLRSLEALTGSDTDDDWYVFTEARHIDSPEVFAGASFTLRDSADLLEDAHPTWDHKLIKETKSRIEELQEQFWRLLEQLSPESYIAEAAPFIYVTRNWTLFADVRNSVVTRRRKYGH